MVNTINTLTERNKELLAKIEELENKEKTEISREAQLKIIERIQNWKKENYEAGDRLKKYQGNTYPSHITNNTTDEWPLWRQLAGHVNFELNMVQYLHQKENPLDELLEIILNSITRNVVGYYNVNGLREKEGKEYEEEKNKYKKKIVRLIKETFPYDKLKENPLKWNERIGGVERGYLDTINGIDYSDYVINYYKEREEELEEKEVFVKNLEAEQEKLEARVEELEERVEIEVEMNLKALDKSEEWGKRQKQELLDRIKELEEENKRLKEQQNGQVAQVEVKEPKKWPWKLKK